MSEPGIPIYAVATMIQYRRLNDEQASLRFGTELQAYAAYRAEHGIPLGITLGKIIELCYSLMENQFMNESSDQTPSSQEEPEESRK